MIFFEKFFERFKFNCFYKLFNKKKSLGSPLTLFIFNNDNDNCDGDGNGNE